MSELTSRRAFMAGGVVAGATSMLGSAAAQAPQSSARKLKIGVIGVGKWSFMTYCWSDIIEGSKPGSSRGNFGMPFLNMEITHVWDPDPAAAQKFAEQLDIVRVNKFDDMLGKIDGLIFAGMVDVPYMKTLAKPYLEAGIPTYLSRPFAYSLRDIDDILESAAKGNAPIIATAKFEHYREIPALRNKLKNVGTIKMVQAAAHTVDFPMHFHIQFMMLKILGYDVKRVSLFYEQATKSRYVHETYLYPGNDTQPPYICTIDGSEIPDSFHIRVVGDQGIETASMPRGYDTWQESLLHRYAPQVIDMQRTFYGQNFEPYDIVRKKTEIYLTAFYSALERGGAPVDVGSVPADWRVRTPDIDTSPTFQASGTGKA
ncbi:MAG: Gfo/Idh/MocA family oxidoreductase [Gammaproteobacteria bacterium]|nr:Gfo/Idh/MocA family oxidoreductase [Gammaproteobacteria bacterium]MDH5304635.1 Gfo/Idh/MocA family oxidoreductase [Gammaproteobacteria bacterium]MDH5322508.1 Gfo/Idh/MocA family oxidoreductase [Gammaproteobacteria bacterium]